MLQQEFEARAIKVSPVEYMAIEEVYNNSDLDKDEFCKQWCKMNRSRVEEYRKRERERLREEKYRDALFDVYYKYRDYSYDKLGMTAINVLTKVEKKVVEHFGIPAEEFLLSLNQVMIRIKAVMRVVA